MPSRAVTLGHSEVLLTFDTYSDVLPSLQEEAAKRMHDAIGCQIGVKPRTRRLRATPREAIATRHIRNCEQAAARLRLGSREHPGTEADRSLVRVSPFKSVAGELRQRHWRHERCNARDPVWEIVLEAVSLSPDAPPAIWRSLR